MRNQTLKILNLHKQATQALIADEREQTARLIQLINTPGDLQECMCALTSFLQRWSGCEAVGIRLREGDDFPYYVTRGFPAVFIQAENSLCAHNTDGKIVHDDDNAPLLECMCGNVLCGRFDPAKPFFTVFGSFWSNKTTALLAENPELTSQAHARNRCFQVGYESVALIPLRVGKQVFGLMQFNDHRANQFTPSLIKLFEEMAAGIALSLSRRQAEEALMNSEMALKKSQRLLAETERVGKVGGWEFDLDTGKQTWTDEVYAIHEVDSTYDPTVKNGINFYTPESRPVIERAVLRTIEHGEPFDLELEIVTGKSNLRSVHVIGKADQENRRIYGFFQDITERKQSEKYREMAREVLRILNEPGSLEVLIPHVLSALKARTGFDAVGIRLQQGDDFPYIVQDGFPQDFLLAENSLIERSVDGGICRDQAGNVYLECTCGLVISGKTDPLNPLFTAGGSCWTNDSFPLLELSADADPRLHPRNECIHQGYASVALVPIRDGGRIVGLIQFNDRRKDCFTLATVERLEEIASYLGAVFMRKRLEEEKLTLQQQFLQAQKLESLGILAGGVAHDFNNILTAIIGNAELAMMRLNPESPVMGHLKQIEKSSTRAADLALQMLAYSGKGRFVVAHIDLNRLIEEMVRMLKVSISKKVLLQMNLQQYLPPVEADASQLRQIIMNLVINASEAIEDKSGVISIATSYEDYKDDHLKSYWRDAPLAEGSYVCLEITDTGCGMSNEIMAKIFDPFFTTKFTGRGLGMAAVQGIVKGHKGAIKVNSEPDKGSTFKILLPASTVKLPESDDAETGNDLWQGDGKVLLVDDEKSVRGIGALMLNEMGYTPITACNGEEGITVFNQNPDISFVILDLTMPHMDGEQCLQELKKVRPDVKVVMSSGYSEQEVAEKFACQELAGFIQKPYKFSELRDVMRSLNHSE